jgi:repressor LexA
MTEKRKVFMGKYAKNRICELRKARKWTQEDVAIRMRGEVTKATVAKLETSTMALTLDYMLNIAAAFGVQPSEIIEAPSSKERKVPLLSISEATQWQTTRTQARSFVTTSDELQGFELFALKVDGDSCDQIIPNGGLVIIDPASRTLVHEAVYLLSINGEAPSFRRFLANPPSLASCSQSAKQPTIEIGQEPFTTIGRVIFTAFAL